MFCDAHQIITANERNRQMSWAWSSALTRVFLYFRGGRAWPRDPLMDLGYFPGPVDLWLPDYRKHKLRQQFSGSHFSRLRILEI